MQINMTTFAGRAPHYVRETVDSLLASDWQHTSGTLNLMLGSDDDSHVRDLATHPRVRIIPWDEETNANMRWNCTLNKIRALRYGEDAPAITCEDDIRFRPDWCAFLHEAVSELEDATDYVLSLFCENVARLAAAGLVPDKALVKHYPTFVLQGAQALYHPNLALRCRIADFLRWNLTQACGDELIGRYARGRAFLFATREVLVRHVGAVSCFT